MVIKSTVDYEGWKRETREHYLSKFPTKEKYINEFIDYISDRYDIHNRVFIPRKLMWYLYNKRQWVIKRNQHFWIAAIGKRGGEGKTTFLGHILHFLDGTYDRKRIAMNYNQFIKVIRQAKIADKYPSVSLDEPETSTHMMSKKGTAMRDILERIRQFNLFVGVCANSMTSIPPFIYERVTAIVYINDKHRFWLWDNAKDDPFHTVVDDIKGKNGWGMYKHGTFNRPEFTRRAYFKNQTFSPELPYDTKQYLKEKEEDLVELLNKFIGKNRSDTLAKKAIEGQGGRILNEILRLKKQNPKLTDAQIGLRLGLRRETINLYRNKAVRSEEAPL